MSSLVLGTFNAQSLVAGGRIEELKRNLLTNGVDICVVQDFVVFRTDRRSHGGGTAMIVQT